MMVAGGPAYGKDRIGAIGKSNWQVVRVSGHQERYRGNGFNEPFQRHTDELFGHGTQSLAT